MALFALLNEQNKVVNVAVISDTKLQGIPQPVSAELITNRTFLKDVGGTWVQTSKEFRGHIACIGDTYDEQLDLFVAPKPFKSWLLDKTTGYWIPPIPMPVDEKLYLWDETTGNWIEEHNE